MKVFGKQLIKKFGQSVRSSGKGRVFQGKRAVSRSVMDVRNPGGRGSNFVKKTVNTSPSPSRWENFKSRAKLASAGILGASGAVGLTSNSQKGSGESINVFISKPTTIGKQIQK